MNERLGDLPAWALDDDDEEEKKVVAPPPPSNGKKKKNKNDWADEGDVEMGEIASGQPTHMDHFFREVDSIKEDIEAVKQATKSIGDINERALQATTTEEENDLSRQLRPLVDQTNKRAKRTKTLLGLLKDETKKLQDTDDIKQSDLR